jgi:primosomal protein N' (replication factor Y)
VVDEEHDQSYKQSDTAPRYNGRDLAVVLASLVGGNALLGSATPSLESYYNTLSGKYAYSELLERYGDAVPPHVIISDTKRALKRGERRGHFNLELKQAISAALERGEQVMLFQNRRGYSPSLQCGDCGWSLRCPSCNVTLTLHRSSQRMECHYCGHTEAVPTSCPNCTAALSMMGFGTEKAEDAVRELFPEHKVLRLDSDTSTSERAYRDIIHEFEQGGGDILVGTQMITKGFDFGRLSLVGVLNADNLMLNPDFRASERAFQLLTQVAGRAGRRERQGEVYIQTAERDNPVIGWVESGDYVAMAHHELAERQTWGYPPYSRLLRLTLKYADAQTLRSASATLAKRLREHFGGRVFGPVEPYVNRIRGEWIVQILLKIEITSSLSRAKQLLLSRLEELATISEWKKINITIDVDPQ